jgi:hypothetical protein
MLYWVGHVAYVEDKRNSYRIFVTKPLWKWQLEKTEETEG